MCGFIALLKVETDGLQRTESLETLTKTLHTFICDFDAPFKVEIDGLQRTESLETLTKTRQTLICDLWTALALNNHFADCSQ